MPIDPLFRVEVVAKTPNPQLCAWVGMHQDYSENFAYDEEWPDEERAGQICVKRLLAGERGHYGPLEHVQIVFNVGWFPHAVMQQARTHRIGCSFDVQSGRYTGQRFIDAANGKRSIEEVFYLRPIGHYSDRDGKKYEYTSKQRERDLQRCMDAAAEYAMKIQVDKMAEEQARGIIPFDFRQHFVVSFTGRAFMHFLDLRAKKDAQEEIRHLCDLMMPHFRLWMPEVAAWYSASRYGKARLAP